MAKSAIYPGTFDPVTNGHSDLIHRAARLFDELVVGIAANPGKAPLFDLNERVALVRVITDDIPNVRVMGFSGLLINCMRDIGTPNVVRGLRAVSDFEYEFQLASMNRRLDPNVESVFLTPSENHTFISASLVKEIAQLGGDVSQFLHPTVHRAVMAKFRDRQAANQPG